MIGATVKHYKILYRIGKGGMGEVFAAEDSILKRKVALKILPGEVAKDPSRAERFQREAESIAALNHPNIVTIHSLEEDAGIHFLTMELVEGKTLGELISANGMDVPTFLRFSIRIAEALTAAHEKKVVHRDLKPTNIMVTDDDRIKILDFGLAKLFHGDSDPEASHLETQAHTEAGILMGTIPYMSPEQVQGKKLDHRTDIFSLGIIFYEMITGQRPFQGNTSADIISSILRDAPDPISNIKKELPEGIERIVRRCLMKNPNERYQTARDVHNDLRDLAETGPLSRSTAVRKTPQHNIPALLTKFVGREHELEELIALLSTNRLVTITGVGGAGKTRLSMEAALRSLKNFSDGVWQVNLATFQSPDLILSVIAGALEVTEESERPLLGSVITSLQNKNLLLVIDSCEHVLDEAARVIETVLRSVPGVRVLATSRESLNVDGEHVWRVPSLSTPGQEDVLSMENAGKFDSVQLFVERAVASDPRFRLNEANLDSVVKICRRLDGIPLAIELAAVRIKAMSASEIYKRLDDCFKLLSSGSRASLQRHQTLRAAVDWSYDLLAPAERILFCRLACFSGGFDLEAAESVCIGGEIEASDVLDLLAKLVDKSLVVLERNEADNVRYRLLEPLRQYALEKLGDGVEATTLGRNHYEYFVYLADKAYQERIESSTYWLERLERDHDNLRAALRWAAQSIDDGGLRLAGALAWFWQLHSHFTEGRQTLRRVLKQNQKRTFEVARALWGASILAIHQGEHEEGRKFAEETVSIWRELGDKKELALALESIGWSVWFGGDSKASYDAFEEALEIHRQMGDERLINRAILNICQILVSEWRVEEAEPLAKKALETGIKLGEPRDIHNAHHYLADCALIRGDVDNAEKKYAASLQAAIVYGDRFEMLFEVEGVAMALAGQGRTTKALRLAGAADAERDVLKAHISIPFWETLKERYLKAAETKAGPEVAQKEKKSGGKMGLERAMQYALDLSRD
ncbi:protein kinase [bacterium]|nr:protein kinase [bacterium]